MYTIYFVMQVLSSSVANGLSYFGDPDTKATEEFCRIMYKIFDCLNALCLNAWRENKKNDLKPYTKPDDPRLKVRLLIVYFISIFHAFVYAVVRK